MGWFREGGGTYALVWGKWRKIASVFVGLSLRVLEVSQWCGIDAGGKSVGVMSGGVCEVEVELKVIGVGMKGNVWVEGKYLEHGDEVNVKKERTKNITLGNTMGDREGGDECELILTVE